MTGFTVGIAMRTIERETGLLVVIKTPFRPVDRRMAERAIVGKTVIVRIFRRVARHTAHRSVPEPLCFVAGRALGIHVFAKQRKAGQTMVKEDVLAPRLFVVTVLAGFSLGTLVRVIVLVAQTASARGLSVKNRLDVAGRAFNTRMRTAEGMLRVDVMIEGQLCPLAGHVAGVAALAKMPVMIVIVAVTGEAGCGQLIGKWVFAVAIITCECRVLPGQTE